jgi:hypothetical protein
MGLLAYDPARLEVLRTAASKALDDVRGIRCDDPEAAAAMIAVRSACRTLNEFCLPRIQDIFNSDAMTSYHRLKLDKNDIRQALVFTMAVAYKWRISSDPFEDDTTIVTTAEARALGARLQHGNLEKLTDKPEELAFIAQQLTIINADPGLRAELLANLTKLDALADTLAASRVQLMDTLARRNSDPTKSVELASIDANLAELTRLYRSPSSTSHAGAYPTWVAGVEPITAALLLRFAGLDPATLAHVSNDLLVRWNDTYPDDEGRQQASWTDAQFAGGPNTADILFQLMLSTPGAASVYVVDAARSPASMWLTATDYRLAQQVALQGTDPANLDPAASGEVLKSFIEFAENEQVVFSNDLVPGHPTGYAAFIGQLVAPWLLQFSPLNGDWKTIDRHDKARLLGLVLHDAGALAAMIGAHRATIDGLIASVGAHGATTFSLKEHAELLGMLGRQIANQQVSNEGKRLENWNNWWDLLTAPVGLLKVVPIAAIAIDKAVSLAHDRVVDEGWLATPTPGKVADTAHYQLEWSLTVAGAGMATIAFFQVGYPPEVAAPPEPDPTKPDPQAQYEEDFARWLKTVPDDGRAAFVESYKSPFLNAASAGESIVD